MSTFDLKIRNNVRPTLITYESAPTDGSTLTNKDYVDSTVNGVSTTLTGDITGTGTRSITTTLSNSGVTAGIYYGLHVDSKGRITSIRNLIADDIPNLDWSKITSGKPNLVNTVAGRYGDITLTTSDITNIGTIATQNSNNVNISGGTISNGTINNTIIGGITAVDGSFTNLSSSGIVSGTGFTNYLASPPAIGGTTSNTGTFTTITTTGNLVFSGTGNRITGDFNNSTQSNRVMFQSSVINSNTPIQAIPNGSATSAGFGAFNSSDPSNASRWYINATTSEITFSSDITGSGTYIPLSFYTGGAVAMKIDTSRNIGIGLTPISNNGILQLGSYASIKELIETATITAAAPSAITNFDVITQGVQYYTSNTTANFTLNIRGDSNTQLNTIMQNGQSITLALLVVNGSNAYYPNVFQIDGTTITPKYANGLTIASGNTNSVDIYSITLIKTAISTFTTLISQTKFS